MPNAQRRNGKGRAPFQVLVLPCRSDGGATTYAVFRRSDADYWQFIAGGGEGSESPEEAARREASEEAGIDAAARLIALDSHCTIPVLEVFGNLPWGPSTLVIPEHAFGIEVCDSILRLSQEHSEYRWVDYETCRAMLHWDSNRGALHELNYRIAHGMIPATDS